MEEDEESKRVSIQVTSLSTQLIESIEKQSRLERQLAHFEKENSSIKEQLKNKENIEQKNKVLMIENKELMTRVNGLGEKLETEIKQKMDAKENVSKLEKEVEELSASLFEEANKMVSDARRKEHEIQLRNDSLVSQLKEKDAVIENLQSQLKVLKDVLHDRDRDLDEASSKRNSIVIDPSQSPNMSVGSQKFIIYSPTVDAVRYDLKFFREFRKFVKTIKDYDTIRDTDTKFIKKVLTDDVDPALRLDVAPGVSWLNKRPAMSAIIDGRVTIEPVSGINETYRLNIQNEKAAETDIKSNLYSYPADSPPVALEQPCALCGEDRNDILEHSRLYIMKVHAKQDSASAALSGGRASASVSHQYPLCSYCLFRLRSACDLFAFLRSLKTDIWKLDNDVIVKKAWLEFVRLRAKLFWARVGIWELDNNIITTKISPNAEDPVYKAISGIADPSRLALYNSVESLADPKSPSAYKSSPLVNQIHNSPERIAVSAPETPLGTGVGLHIDSTSICSDKDSGEPVEGDEGNDHEDVGDIIGDYSHDEAEEEEEANSSLPANVHGLKIQTEEDRPQDSLLDSEQSTPIIGRASTSVLNTPVAGTGFDFEKQATPTKERPAQVQGENENKGSTTTTDDDESEFVDA